MAEDKKLLLEYIEPLLEAEDKIGLEKLLKEQRYSDIAEVVETLDEDELRMVFDVLDEETSAEVIEKVDEATRNQLFDILKSNELRAILLELGPDEAADLLAELPDDECQKLLSSLSAATATSIRKLMSYNEDSAGGIMDPILISVDQNASVAEAVSKIRAAEIDEDFYGVFVVDEGGKFIGDVRIRLLLTASESTKIADLLDPDPICVDAEADQEEVRNLFRKNDLIVAPVLDSSRRLIGRITADRIIEVAEEEAAEDIYIMAGTDADELDKDSTFRAARIRMTWLSPCLVGTGVTALVMLFFQSNFKVIFLAAAAFAPMVAAISGNAGLQTSAIVVSGLASGNLAALKFNQVLSREVRIAVLVAICCGLLGGLACFLMLWLKDSQANPVEALRLVLALGTAMFAAIMVATTLGLILPFLFRGVGIDPAISSGPLVTTANDSISVCIYLALAVVLAGL